MVETVEQWVRQRRRELRDEVAQLEDALIDAGHVPASGPTASDDGDSYELLVAPLEQHASLLRAQAVREQLVPPAGTLGHAEQPARVTAPSDWLERLTEEQRARSAAESRAARAETARQAAEDAHRRSSEAVEHLYAAVQRLVGGGEGTELHGEDAAGEMTVAQATRMVLRAGRYNDPVTIPEVCERAARLLGEAPNPSTIRVNLGRLRERGEIQHDPTSSTYWLTDPEDPTWRPGPQLRSVRS